MRMPVSVNARFRKQSLTGVQRFAAEVTRVLADGIAVSTRELLPKHAGSGWRGHAWEQFVLPRSVGSTALFSPANTGPLSVSRQMVVIHDAAVWDQPDGFTKRFRAYYRWLLPRLARCCKIATVSEFSRQRLAHHLGLSAGDIAVFGNAVGPQFQPPPDDARSDQAYVLCVGSLEPRKNLGRLFDAWDLVRLKCGKDQDIELRIVGSANPLAFRGISLGRENDRVRWMGSVNDAELVSLYQHARAFLFPSVYEGFGIPPLEAMACGCPVVMSEVTSMPEVGGVAFDVEDGRSEGSALYFDPHDVEGMAYQIVRLLELEAGQLARLKQNALRHARVFTWAEVAAKARAALLNEFG